MDTLELGDAGEHVAPSFLEVQDAAAPGPAATAPGLLKEGGGGGRGVQRKLRPAARQKPRARDSFSRKHRPDV